MARRWVAGADAHVWHAFFTSSDGDASYVVPTCGCWLIYAGWGEGLIVVALRNKGDNRVCLPVLLLRQRPCGRQGHQEHVRVV